MLSDVVIISNKYKRYTKDINLFDCIIGTDSNYCYRFFKFV